MQNKPKGDVKVEVDIERGYAQYLRRYQDMVSGSKQYMHVSIEFMIFEFQESGQNRIWEKKRTTCQT